MQKIVNFQNSLNEYIVVYGQVIAASEYNGDPSEINGTEAVRVYAVSPAWAWRLADDYDRGSLQPDNTPLGEPGIVQKPIG